MKIEPKENYQADEDKGRSHSLFAHQYPPEFVVTAQALPRPARLCMVILTGDSGVATVYTRLYGAKAMPEASNRAICEPDPQQDANGACLVRKADAHIAGGRFVFSTLTNLL
jgi:hypothetical protein